MATPQEKNMQDYQTLQFDYLAEAEQMFGPQTEYEYSGLSYYNYAARTELCDSSMLAGHPISKIQLHGKAIDDRKDGVFQLSHEVVHLISPVEQDEGNEVNYMKEGMATYFSKLITEYETGDYEYCDTAMAKHPKYLKAYQLYVSLAETDKDVVKKLRETTPVIANIQPEYFTKAGFIVNTVLIDALLAKF